MSIKSKENLTELDKQMSLIEEDDWDFFGIEEADDSNFEYFNDIRDIDFTKATRTKFETIVPVLCIILSMASIILIALNVTGYSFRKQPASTPVQSTGLARIEGEQADNDAMVGCSTTLSRYFSILQSQSGYTDLNNLCQGGSTFDINYEKMCNSIQSSYDIYDGSARVLKLLGSSCSVGQINEIIESDDLYYCYVTLNTPSSHDMYEYLYLYQYNMSKFFTTNSATEENMLKFMAETLKTNSIQCSSAEYCIILNKDFKITDDSQIYGICNSTYSSGVSQLGQMIGASQIHQ